MRSVGIVGCGTAGQAAAILLARAGFEVRVFEQAPSLGPVGAGLLVQPTGMSVLARLGVAERLMALGSPIERLLGTTDTGRRVLDIRYADLRDGLRGYGLQRSAISTVLSEAMRGAGITPTTGVLIDRVTEDQRFVIDAGGERHGPFDVIIAADGSRSRLRSCFGHLVRRDRGYDWGALWIMREDSDGGYAEVLRQVYRGTGVMLGTLPCGRAAPGAPNLVSLFWSIPADTWQGAERFDFEHWCARVRDLTDHADAILSQAHGPEEVIYAPYRDVVMTRPYDRRVVFIGDAAHAMSPQLGQGVNLALMDAAALTDALCESDSMHAAFLRFHRARRKNVAFYQWASRWLTPVFQSDLEWLAPARNGLTNPMNQIPFVRRQALLSLAGVKTGLLSASALPSGVGGTW